ncbi:hypothetical protein BZA77DRAFT_91826 [Pyronema omphalodes]|nr:hypothetical protein BZA77DRAFT_91826 [Pyronema omphalodes]
MHATVIVIAVVSRSLGNAASNVRITPCRLRDPVYGLAIGRILTLVGRSHSCSTTNFTRPAFSQNITNNSLVLRGSGLFCVR